MYGATDEEAAGSAPRAPGPWGTRRLPRAAVVVGTVGLWALAFGGTLPAAPAAAPPAALAAKSEAWCVDGAFARRAELCNDAALPALGGADVVAYRDLAWAESGAARDASVGGDAAHAAAYGGATFWFASAAHRDAFAADPAAFAPRAGGFCAFGLTGADPRNGDPRLETLHTMPVDPDVWWLGDGGALYLFRGDEAMRLFLAAGDAGAAAADATWSRVASGCPGASLVNSACLHEGGGARAPHS